MAFQSSAVCISASDGVLCIAASWGFKIVFKMDITQAQQFSSNVLATIYMFKVSNRNVEAMSKICSN